MMVAPDVDADPTTDGNAAVRTAIAESLLDSAMAGGLGPAAVGVDVESVEALQLDVADDEAGLASVVPTSVPSLGLRQLAETTRVIAAIALGVFGVIAVLAHPSSGRGLRRLGFVTVIVCGAWLVGLFVTGRIIALIADTLLGELLQTVWTDAVPPMLLLVTAGVVIGAGVVLAGIAAEGWARQRAVRR